MAKAKKASADNETKATKAAPKKAPAKKPEKPAAPAGTPLINTDLAAANAARMLLASTKKSAEQPVSKSSGLIDQLKADLNKPAGSSMANLLDKTAGPAGKRPGLPTGPQKQLGHNQ